MANNEFDNAQSDKQALIEFVIQPKLQDIVAEHGFLNVLEAMKRIAKDEGYELEIE